jgi:pimeloyl-ACP methyl ester carboxylesterase
MQQHPSPERGATALPDCFDYLLIPGFGGTGRLFEPLIAGGAFASPPRVHAYPAGAATVADIVDSILARPRRWERTVIIAESLGGVIAAELCARLPAPPAAIVFCAAFATAPRPVLLRLVRWLPVGLIRRIGLSRAAIRAACLSGGAAGLVGTTRTITSAFTGETWRQRLAMIESADIRASLARLARSRVPLCYLRARHDRLIPARISRAFCALLPGITHLDLPGPHFLLQTAPLACAVAIARFLETVRAANAR